MTHRRTLISTSSHTPSSPSRSCIVPTHLHLSRNPEWPSLDLYFEGGFVEVGMKTESYDFSASWKERTADFPQKENKHVTSIQLNTVSNKKNNEKTQALCSGLDSNRDPDQSYPSLNSTHIHTSSHRICLHTEKRITPAFYWTATTRLESGKRTDLPTSCSLAEPLAPRSEIKLTELTDFVQPSPEEQRSRRLSGPGRGPAGGSQKQDRGDSPGSVSPMESRRV